MVPKLICLEMKGTYVFNKAQYYISIPVMFLKDHSVNHIVILFNIQAAAVLTVPHDQTTHLCGASEVWGPLLDTVTKLNIK